MGPRDVTLPDLGVLGGRRCYVAGVEPLAERRVLRKLRAIGVFAWLPECRIRRRDARRKIMVLGEPEPVFPGYLLVWLELTRRARQADGDGFGHATPGYLARAGLLSDIADDRFAAVEATPGVDCLLRRIGSQQPCALPGADVAELRRQIDEAGGELIIDQEGCRWRKNREERAEICGPGGHVQVIGGAFAGFSGLYLQATAAGRIKILLDFFGRPTAVEIEEALAQAIATGLA